jgi:RsiW-degrading membrane proteinase PrsW (M82 family)
MFKVFYLMIALFIAIFIAILSFQNLFFTRSSFYILFWTFSATATWLIILTFFLGIIFGLAVFMFFHSNPTAISSSGNDNDW